MRVLKYIQILITQLICIVCFAQTKEIDSLKNVLPLLKDTSRIDCLNELSFQYTRLLNRDSAEYFESAAYKESEKINYVHGIAESLSNQSGIVEYFDNDFIQAETLARKSLTLFEKMNNNRGIENTIINLWFSLFAQSKYDEAYIIALRRYENSKMLNDSSNMIDALQSSGVIFFQKGNYDSAFYFYKQAENIAIISKNNTLISDLLYSIGTLYKKIGDYQTAINYYRKVFQADTRETIQKRIDGSYETWARMEFAELFGLTGQFDSAWHYYNLFDTSKMTDKDFRIYLISTGETNLLQRNYETALQHFLHGLAIHRKLNDRNEIKRALLDVAKTYFALGNNSSALQYARESLDISLQTKSRQFIRDGYQILYLVYDRLHKTDSAYFYCQKFIAIKDSVLNDQLKGRYDAYKYEQQISTVNNEKRFAQQQLKIRREQLNEESFQKKILIASLILILLLGLIIFRNTILKRRNEKLQLENKLKQQQLEAEKTKSELQHQASELEMQALRAQMNPHFIFNCLSSINRFILKTDTEAASNYLTKFSRLLRMVLNNSKKAFISLEDELEMLCLYLDMEKLRFKNSFDYRITFINSIDTGNVFVPPLLLQPFAENAIWHGLMHREGQGLLEIELSMDNKILTCAITDNGVGRNKASEIKSKSIEKQKSMGLQITKERLALHNKNHDAQTFFNIEDLTDNEGKSAGTRVILKMNYKDLTEVVS